jgi:hypothetical protein
LLFALAHDPEATETLQHCCFAGDAIDGVRSVQPFQTLASGDLCNEQIGLTDGCSALVAEVAQPTATTPKLGAFALPLGAGERESTDRLPA